MKTIKEAKPKIDPPFDDILCGNCDHNVCLITDRRDDEYIPKFCAECGCKIKWDEFNEWVQ